MTDVSMSLKIVEYCDGQSTNPDYILWFNPKIILYQFKY